MRTAELFEAFFLLLTALLVAGMWIITLNTGVPGMSGNIIRYAFHWTSELLLTIFMVMTGIGLLMKSSKIRRISFFTLGLLLCSAVMAAVRYWDQAGWTLPTALVGTVCIVTLFFIINSFKIYTRLLPGFRHYISFGLFNLGILLYLLINISGSYAQRKEWSTVIVLIYLIIVGMLYVLSLVKKKG